MWRSGAVAMVTCLKWRAREWTIGGSFPDRRGQMRRGSEGEEELEGRVVGRGGEGTD